MPTKLLMRVFREIDRRRILDVLEAFVVVSWLGMAYTLSLLVLPKAFATLPRPFAGDLAESLLQIYFLFSIGCVSFLMMRHAWMKPWEGGPARTKTILLVLCALALGFQVGWAVPHMHTLKAGGLMDTLAATPEAKAFRLWHGASMAANLLVLLCGIPLIFFLALKKAPKPLP